MVTCTIIFKTTLNVGLLNLPLRSNFTPNIIQLMLTFVTIVIQDLPGFPEVAPDASVRDVEPPKPATNPWKQDQKQKKVRFFTLPCPRLFADRERLSYDWIISLKERLIGT